MSIRYNRFTRKLGFRWPRCYCTGAATWLVLRSDGLTEKWCDEHLNMRHAKATARAGGHVHRLVSSTYRTPSGASLEFQHYRQTRNRLFSIYAHHEARM